MRIGDAARLIGVPAHVLRHWDDMGVVSPSRTASGHREYDEEQVRRLRVLRACQEVGLSLAEIRLVLHRDEAGRAQVIQERLSRIRDQRERLADAESFLEHVRTCRHDLLTRCPACSRFADEG
jgi:MerR family copper efflux transcriptional regulator